MPFHKFKIGQRVSYQPSRSNFPVRWVVTALVPAEDRDLKYRIRRLDAPEDLVVSEKHLRETRAFEHLVLRAGLLQDVRQLRFIDFSPGRRRGRGFCFGSPRSERCEMRNVKRGHYREKRQYQKDDRHCRAPT
jgi:hypothetical protein